MCMSRAIEVLTFDMQHPSKQTPVVHQTGPTNPAVPALSEILAGPSSCQKETHQICLSDSTFLFNLIHPHPLIDQRQDGTELLD